MHDCSGVQICCHSLLGEPERRLPAPGRFNVFDDGGYATRCSGDHQGSGHIRSRLLSSSTVLKSVADSLSLVQEWVEARDYKGYDPADGLSSWLRPFTFSNRFAERVLQQ